MPKIQAPTVDEHRAMQTRKLVDAAEALLRESNGRHLSGGAVAVKAGMARNSIYRYVQSVDELRLLVLERNIPLWRAQVMQDINMNGTPAERLAEIVAACIRQSAEGSSHQWLMGLMRNSGGKPVRKEAENKVARKVASVHNFFDDMLNKCWKDLGVAHPDVWASFTRAIIVDGFKQIEHGASPAIVCSTAKNAVLLMTNEQKGD